MRARGGALEPCGGACNLDVLQRVTLNYSHFGIFETLVSAKLGAYLAFAEGQIHAPHCPGTSPSEHR